MAIVKGSSESKKVKIPLYSKEKTSLDSVPIPNQSSSNTDKKTNVREIGILKPAKPTTDIAITSSAHEPEIPAHISSSLDQFEADQKRLIMQKLADFEAAQMGRIRTKIDEFHTQQIQTTQSEMAKLRDQGFKDGYSEGLSKGERQYSEQLRELASAINDVTKNKHQFFENSEPELVKLALKIAEKIVHTHIDIDPTAMSTIVNEAIKRITDKDKVIIKVAPEDADFIRQNREKILEKMPDIRTLEVQDDPRIERGGCIIETQLGFIDSLISTKLASIETALFKILNDE